MEALVPGHMMRMAKKLSAKAAGIDATNDLLKHFLFEGMQDLAQLMRHSLPPFSQQPQVNAVK